MLVYFAAPLFSQAEKEFNLNLTQKIENRGFDVFLPQRDGAELGNFFDESYSPEEKQKFIFEKDRDKVFESDIFLFILDGRIPDEGACFELGLVYSHKRSGTDKKIIGLHTDMRVAFPDAKLNCMISEPLDVLFETEDQVLNYLQEIYKEQ